MTWLWLAFAALIFLVLLGTACLTGAAVLIVLAERAVHGSDEEGTGT